MRVPVEVSTRGALVGRTVFRGMLVRSPNNISAVEVILEKKIAFNTVLFYVLLHPSPNTLYCPISSGSASCWPLQPCSL